MKKRESEFCFLWQKFEEERNDGLIDKVHKIGK